MAASGLGLCLILTLWMTGSRPPTAVPPRSLDSSLWWGRQSLEINTRALTLRKAGDLRGAEQIYRAGYDEAVRRRDSLAATRFLISVGGCQLLGYHYQAALTTFLAARALATSLHDHADLGGISVNLSSIYLQMWDFPAALRTAEEGLAEARQTGRPYFKPYLLLHLGWLHSLLGDGREEPWFEAGIEAARAQGPWTIEAKGWDLLGETRLAAGRTADAERAFLEAFRLRRYFLPAELGYSYAQLGRLFLARGDLDAAGRFTSLATAAERRGALSWPRYHLLEQAGRIRVARGEIEQALKDFSLALDSTALWRLEVLRSRSSLSGANAALDSEVFRSFIDTAAMHALATKNQFWAEKAFQAVEVNRGASLRESLALAEGWKEKLPPGYWETLGQLGAEEGGRARGGLPNERAAGLNLRLTEMEAQAGIGLKPKNNENFLTPTSLIHFQEGLRDSELLLSFSLGKTESYLWAVGRSSVRLYRLAGEQEIGNAVQAFREALPKGGTEAILRGQQLYLQLFGQLDPRETRTTAWFLSLEGALFQIPFAALVIEHQGGNIVYLVDRHSIQTVPGALLLGAPAERPRAFRGEFVGVGDPIYNAADPRWGGSRADAGAGGQLSRLVASREEVESSGRSWKAGSGTLTLLEGRDASRTKFLRALERRPAVIHLATHVVIPSGENREQAFVAFGMPAASAGHDARPEYLNTSEIAGLSVPGALVVMSGCATGTGDVRAGAGLLGLTRAWLMAGASTVLATAWPEEDTSGEIFRGSITTCGATRRRSLYAAARWKSPIREPGGPRPPTGPRIRSPEARANARESRRRPAAPFGTL
jgi:CHAT domain-containing protein